MRFTNTWNYFNCKDAEVTTITAVLKQEIKGSGLTPIRTSDLFIRSFFSERETYNFKQREFLQLHCLHFLGVPPPSFDSKVVLGLGPGALGDP